MYLNKIIYKDKSKDGANIVLLESCEKVFFIYKNSLMVLNTLDESAAEEVYFLVKDGYKYFRSLDDKGGI